jgi:protein SCO1
MAGVPLMLVAVSALAQVPPPLDPLSFNGPDPLERFKTIEIVQHLDAQLPLDLEFTDETGRRVVLGDLLDGKPALLALVYYECPMLCQEELKGLSNVVKAMKFMPGEDYNIITVSIDPEETPELAAAKKRVHMERVGRPGAENGWHFLVGDEDSIDLLADTVGFRYIYDPKTDQYAHAAGIMSITPDGKIARYFMGIEFIRRDVEFGLTEAGKGSIGSLVDQVVLLCFQYDPSTGQYGFYVFRAMQILSGLLILSFAGMYAVFYFSTRTKKRKKVMPKVSAVAEPNGGTAK